MGKVGKATLWIAVSAAGCYIIYRQAGKTLVSRARSAEGSGNVIENARECFNAFLKDFKAAQSERERQLSQGLTSDR